MKQPWIQSPAFDLAWFLAPGILPVVVLLCFPGVFGAESPDLSPLSWLFLVLFVDVAHVYSTVYRTYFNPQARVKYAAVFRFVPLVGWAIGVLLFAIEPLLFWRCLAYLAVFHFIRQQYGFMRLYSRKTQAPAWVERLHTFVIYIATLGPILIWHCTGPKNFNWFVEGDFLYVDIPALALVLKALFFLSLALYTASELYLYRKTALFNIPRFLFVAGTAASWYIGIVVFNGDLAFTMLNVLSHGIPYMALIWASEKRAVEKSNSAFLRLVFSTYGVAIFLGLILLMGYLEEGIWDAFVWREHQSLFGVFYGVEKLSDSRLLAFLVPLLALPQITHYVLDGFIWKREKESGKVLKSG